MKLKGAILVLMCATVPASAVGAAEQEFYGIIEKRPKENVGAWVIGGRKIEVTAKTRLEPDHGPLNVGACVEVEYVGNRAIEIASETKDKCKK